MWTQGKVRMNQLKLYGYIALVITVLGAFYGAYRYGYSEAEEAAKVVKLAELEKTNESYEKLKKDYSDLSVKLAKEKQNVKVETKYITKKVVEYVQNPDRTVCTYDDEWLRNKQAILENADTRK